MRIHNRGRLFVVGLCLLAATGVGLFIACRGGKGGSHGPAGGSASGGGQSSATGPVPALPGQLLITGESTLDFIANGRRTVIARAPSVSTYFEYPVFAPDCKSIAYVLATTPTGQGQDWGNDIYTANPDGTGAKLVLKHDKPGTLIDSLSWTPDGAGIVYAYSRAIYDAQNHYTGSIYRIDRLSLADGSSKTLINNAMQPSISMDGKQIVYVDFPQNDFQAAGLAIANSDGSGSRKLLTDQRGFQGFFAPHLSPDGKRLVFAAVGGPIGAPVTPTPGLRNAPGSGGGGNLLTDALRQWLLPKGAEADGSPYQVWTVNIDGTGLHTVTNLREDLPYPIWSADGQTILFLGAAGLYTANADGTNLKRIGNGVPHGELSWCQHP